MVWRGERAPPPDQGRQKTRGSSVGEEYKEEGKVSENKGIKTNSMETSRITNAREHLRKINKCGTQLRGRICIYTYKNTSKQTGYNRYKTVNIGKAKIRG